MGAYQDVYLPRREAPANVVYLLRGAQAAYHFHLAGKIRKARSEGIVMLESQYRRRHQHRHLFSVAGGLESRPDGDFRLAETNVPAHQTVHRAAVLHILLD